MTKAYLTFSGTFRHLFYGVSSECFGITCIYTQMINTDVNIYIYVYIYQISNSDYIDICNIEMR
jgi:hypothetical protein